jgi:flagellar hook-basal body complex protein FliE
MLATFNNAINAYNNAAKGTGLGTPGAGDADAAGGPAFSDFLASSVSEAIGTMHKSEDVSAQALVGKASANDVVVAMTNAEMTLNEVTKIRDQVVSAYEDILKMPI